MGRNLDGLLSRSGRCGEEKHYARISFYTTCCFFEEDRSLIPRRDRGFFLLATASRPVLGPTQPPFQWVPRPLTQWVKRPCCETDH
jgi:hypothetical protein